MSGKELLYRIADLPTNISESRAARIWLGWVQAAVDGDTEAHVGLEAVGRVIDDLAFVETPTSKLFKHVPLSIGEFRMNATVDETTTPYMVKILEWSNAVVLVTSPHEEQPDNDDEVSYSAIVKKANLINDPKALQEKAVEWAKEKLAETIQTNLRPE